VYLWRQNVTFIDPDMWPPSSPDLNPVNYTIWVVLHFLFYAVYICQKSLNFTYAFKCYQQNCSWLHFKWPTLYSADDKSLFFFMRPIILECTGPIFPKIFRIGRHFVEMINLTFVLRIGENFFMTLTFQNDGLEDRNAEGALTLTAAMTLLQLMEIW